MAKKKLYIKRGSKVHGYGLFAVSDISKGTRIIEYVGEKITNAESDRRYEEWEEKARKKDDGIVYLFEINKRHTIDGNFPYNIAKFINHSCNPNCESDVIKGRIWISAIKDIKKGEELNYDYGYDIDNWEDHPCKCGSENCVGYIVSEEHWPKLKQRLAYRKKKLVSSKRLVGAGKIRSK